LKFGFPVELDDPLRNPIGMALFLCRIFKKLVGDSLGVDAPRRVVMPLVAQDANQLRRERLVEEPENGRSVRSVTVRDGPAFDVLVWRARRRISWMSARNAPRELSLESITSPPGTYAACRRQALRVGTGRLNGVASASERSSPAAHVPDQADEEENDEDEEENFGYSSRGKGDRAKAQQAGDDRDNQKH
jgi:hypothetical protein